MEKLYKAVEICLEMLQDRGYTSTETHETEDKDEMTVLVNETTNSKICIHINYFGKLNVQQIESFFSKTQSIGLNHCIILYQNSITPKANKIISICKIKCELFTIDELQYNLTKHYLVPKHIRLNVSQSKTFKAKYGTKIPILFSSDPVSRYYDFKCGDIIRIERKDNIIGYRIVK